MKIEENKKIGKCPCCGDETPYSKVYGFYCGCQGLGGVNEYDEEYGY